MSAEEPWGCPKIHRFIGLSRNEQEQRPGTRTGLEGVAEADMTRASACLVRAPHLGAASALAPMAQRRLGRYAAMWHTSRCRRKLTYPELEVFYGHEARD
jgi:hypothetical protein